MGSELLRLYQRSLGQVAAGDAGREAEIVVDARTGASLSAGSDTVDAEGSQSLGGAVSGEHRDG